MQEEKSLLVRDFLPRSNHDQLQNHIHHNGKPVLTTSEQFFGEHNRIFEEGNH
jgi:hypothetical protein